MQAIDPEGFCSVHCRADATVSGVFTKSRMPSHSYPSYSTHVADFTSTSVSRAQKAEMEFETNFIRFRNRIRASGSYDEDVASPNDGLIAALRKSVIN